MCLSIFQVDGAAEVRRACRSMVKVRTQLQGSCGGPDNEGVINGLWAGGAIVPLYPKGPGR
ncbi:hypothetical protein GCM10011341_17530 [Frigidibacter albus]|nr:hypothetical protein GCM10011341_17530 [Frigidibacter albus]